MIYVVILDLNNYLEFILPKLSQVPLGVIFTNIEAPVMDNPLSYYYTGWLTNSQQMVF